MAMAKTRSGYHRALYGAHEAEGATCFPPGKYREHQPEMMDWPLAPRGKGRGPRGHTLLSEIPATTHVSAKDTVSEGIGLIPFASCG